MKAVNNEDFGKVSIIIPLYNVEKFVPRLVDSVISQDYENIEIILVDDGSPDNSGKIADDYSKKDSRITVIHKNNGGVSTARNAGIRAATGEYILFVDGDDWVEPDYVSYFIELVKYENCEIGMNINNFSGWKDKSSLKKYSVNAEKAIEWIYTGKLFVAVWNKIYKTSFLQQNHILFDEEIWYGEGMLFNIDCLQCVEKVAIGEKNVYHQTPNPDSAMRKFNLESNYCGIRSLEIQKEHWKKSSKTIEYAWNYHRRAFNWSIMSGLARSNQDKEYIDVYNECASNLRKNLWQSLRVDIPLKEKIKYLALAIDPYYMAARERRKCNVNKIIDVLPNK